MLYIYCINTGQDFFAVILSIKAGATFVRGQSFLELALGNGDMAF